MKQIYVKTHNLRLALSMVLVGFLFIWALIIPQHAAAHPAQTTPLSSVNK